MGYVVMIFDGPLIDHLISADMFIAFNAARKVIAFEFGFKNQLSLLRYVDGQFARSIMIDVRDIIVNNCLLATIGQSPLVMVPHQEVNIRGDDPFQVGADRPEGEIALAEGFIIVSCSIASEKSHRNI